MAPLPASLTVVIPTYNERENLESLARELLALPVRPRLLIVDDNSPDGTGAIADALHRDFPERVDVLHRTAKEGLGRAYVAGFQRALDYGTTHIAQMDADHSHAPNDLQRLFEAALETDADLVIGNRYIDGGATVGWSRHRLLISRLGGIYAGLVVGVPVRDLTGGFKVWTRETLADIDLPSIHADGYGFQIETTWRALQREHVLEQVPIIFHDRTAGASKFSRKVVMEAAVLPWQMRWRQLRREAW